MSSLPSQAFHIARPVRDTPGRRRPLLLSEGSAEAARLSGAFLASAVAAEARVMTPEGPRAAGKLRAGQHVLTESGPVRILWTRRHPLPAERIAEGPGLSPILVAAHAFGGGAPRRPLRLSPRAGMVRRVGGRRMIVPAVACLDLEGVGIAPVAAVTYVQILLERHAVIFAGGVPLESLHPGARYGHRRDRTLRRQLLSDLAGAGRELKDYGPEILPRAMPR
ncbi:Hint domain-containing protein [Roseicyclus sp. F158]|uniref:Hint domain-containing protein n=1 Tax=Tropicimonas omnivorans TaxID=3075590 RepID=A0ABU3DKF3_9RHOB|nr:Hint domain-containing protein [Roseicyclus sp. F158]MDT0684014.1 Hint domain-containing protein [Roseicyclus sp. F158]